MLIRKEIQEFAEEMEMKMSQHDDDRGDSWKNEPLEFFKKRLYEEFDELMKELDAPNPHITKSVKEGADLANIAMMACWRVKEDWIKRISKNLIRSNFKLPE
jgi:hypothetical protein